MIYRSRNSHLWAFFISNGILQCNVKGHSHYARISVCVWNCELWTVLYADSSDSCFHNVIDTNMPGPDLRGGAGGPGHRPPTNRGPPTKPFIFFSFVICVCVTLGFYSLSLSDPKWAGPQAPHQLNPALLCHIKCLSSWFQHVFVALTSG